MNLHVLPAGPHQTNAYLLTSPERAEAVLIDAPLGVWSAVATILSEEKCRLAELWITHGHWEQMQGGGEVERATRAKVRAHAFGLDVHEGKELMLFMNLYKEVEGFHIEGLWVHEGVFPGDRLAVLGTEAEVRHVPGHYPGNVLFYFPPRPDITWLSTGAAFVGDAICNGGVGRTDLEYGDCAELERSIRTQIYTLPDATVIFPGHGPSTTVGAEKEPKRGLAPTA